MNPWGKKRKVGGRFKKLMLGPKTLEFTPFKSSHSWRKY
jgi:hypothetical protein